MDANTNTTEAAVKAARLAVYEGETEIGVLEKIADDLRAARQELRGEIVRSFDDSSTPTYAIERKIAPAPAEWTRARPACRAAQHRDADQAEDLDQADRSET